MVSAYIGESIVINETGKKGILIVSLMRADRTIGGFAFRFIALYDYLVSAGHSNIFLVTNKSLLNSYALRQKRPLHINNLCVFNDFTRWYIVKRILLVIRILWIIRRKKIRTVHLAAGGLLYLGILQGLSKIIGIRIAITFPSNSLDMASYGGNATIKKQWNNYIKKCRNIDILNPNYSLPQYGYKVFVSPCSFPLNLRPIHEIAIQSTGKKNHIVFAGSMSATKNPVLAVEGMYCFYKKYKDEFADARCMLFGKGVLLEEIKKKVTQFNAAIGVEVIILQKDDLLFTTLAGSKIFLSLQDFDNYPSQSLMEAMLFSNTIVATDTGYTSNIVLTEFGNKLLRSKAPEELAEAIYDCLKEYALNLQNKNFIEKNHTIERFVEYFLSMHQSLI
jgi:glycosyltransferase involved in cell wall biosynthesis